MLILCSLIVTAVLVGCFKDDETMLKDVSETQLLQ
jgi:hypothetical protein